MKSVFFSIVAFVSITQSELLPSSCRDLEDGDHWIKLLDGDDYPAIYVTCSNGYILLDYSKDNNLKEYFNTWAMWHQHTAGPTNDVHVNWMEWFIPDDGSTSYIISPDCSNCEVDHRRQLYGQKSAYWMTGTLFGCFWAIKGAHNCDVDWDTDECYTCIGSTMTDQGNNRVVLDDDSKVMWWQSSGICPHSVQSADHYVPLTHDACTHEESMVAFTHDSTYVHLKPSLGTEGKYCVCASPSTTQYYETETIPTTPLQPETIEEPSYQYKTLTMNDFKYGTYRITKPGTYKIMEDITFDFNAVPNDPNSDGAYLPHEDQSNEYPGAGDYRDPFFLGFFAGITIETDNVILDLNGYTLKMSDYFYYQQRWFTTIELSTQYFLPGQGIGNFGAQPKTASNVIIKDGTLGLTTHHGIHGNYNTNIRIENVIVRDFETCGIQFNGFSDITIKDVEVGPTSNKAFFNGEYGHMRLLLPRYRKIAEETPGQTIKFDGRDEAVTMEDIADELEKQMNFAFNYVVHGTEISQDNIDYESFGSAIDLFVNQEGIPNGGAQYGIFLNTFGASVFTYNLYTGFFSERAILENIKIHGMRHNIDEYVRLHFYKSGDIVINPFNGPLELSHIFDNIEDFSNPKYKGNILTDAYMASNYLSDNFYYLQLQLILNDKLVAWATGEKDFYTAMESDQIQLGCNSDVMIHSGKGISGLRLDGVDGVTVTNLEVYDISDESPVGTDTCGDYTNFCALCGTTGGHFRQTAPMQIGFSGNMAQAVNINAAENIEFEDVSIYDITSFTGPTFGMSIWPACDVTLKGNINVERLLGGSTLNKGTYDYSDRPNKAPETCAMRAYWSYSSYTTSINYDNANINSKCIGGHVGCHGSSIERTMLGDYNNECDIQGWDSSFQDEENNDNQSDNSFKKIMKNEINLSVSNTIKNEVIRYIPEQTIWNIFIEFIVFSIIMFIVTKIYLWRKNRNNRIEYSLLDNKDNNSNIHNQTTTVVF